MSAQTNLVASGLKSGSCQLSPRVSKKVSLHATDRAEPSVKSQRTNHASPTLSSLVEMTRSIIVGNIEIDGSGRCASAALAVDIISDNLLRACWCAPQDVSLTGLMCWVGGRMLVGDCQAQ
jgi:hypothetical protein